MSGTMDNYAIQLENFEGPLDLLLHLIKKNEMDVYDIPMAEITRQYLSILDAMKSLNLDMAGEFLLMAATLLHIKSKMLLDFFMATGVLWDLQTGMGKNTVGRIRQSLMFPRQARSAARFQIRTGRI